MTRKLLVLILVFSSQFGFGQLSYEDIQDSTINIADFNEKSIIKIKRNLDLFTPSKLDSLDFQIMTSESVFAHILVKILEEDKKTYADLLNEFMRFKKTDLYVLVKDNLIQMNFFNTTIIDQNKWPEHKKYLLQFNLTPEFIKIIEDSVYTEKSPVQITYSEYFNQKRNKNKSQEDLKHEVRVTKFWSLFEERLINIDSLYSLAKQEGKLILIYFTGYNVVNCRKIEETVLKSREILPSILEDFIFIPYYIDSRLKLQKPNMFHSEILDRNIEYYGGYNYHYQKKLFQNGQQPFFVCLNEKKQIIGKGSYSDLRTIELFSAFLNFCQGK